MYLWVGDMSTDEGGSAAEDSWVGEHIKFLDHRFLHLFNLKIYILAKITKMLDSYGGTVIWNWFLIQSS